jgi:hypothetical protein
VLLLLLLLLLLRLNVLYELHASNRPCFSAAAQQTCSNVSAQVAWLAQQQAALLRLMLRHLMGRRWMCVSNIWPLLHALRLKTRYHSSDCNAGAYHANDRHKKTLIAVQ